MCCAFLKTGRIFSFLLVPVMVIYDAFSSESGPRSCLGWESVDKESIVSQCFPENLSNYEAYPHQGLSEALRDRNVFRNFLVTGPPWGISLRGVIVHHEGIISGSFNKMVIFQERTRVYVSFFREFTLDGIPFSKVKRKKIRKCC
jgi:hypothetical protein